MIILCHNFFIGLSLWIIIALIIMFIILRNIYFMQKDFDLWNEQKKGLEVCDKHIFFKEWEVRRTSIWLNIWWESCGKWSTFRRPVLIIKKLSSISCIVLPMTSKYKTGTWFSEIIIHAQRSRILLYQIRIISIKRLQRRYATIDKKDFFIIKEKLKQLLEL